MEETNGVWGGVGSGGVLVGWGGWVGVGVDVGVGAGPRAAVAHRTRRSAAKLLPEAGAHARGGGSAEAPSAPH